MKYFVNGKVYLEKGRYAESFAVDEQTIQAVDSLEDYDASVDQMIDLKGKTVIPGLYDSHVHMVQFGNRLTQLNLAGAKSVAEIIDRGKKFLADRPETTFLFASGWDQDAFVDGHSHRFLNRHDLDQISTEIPIVADRFCTHVASLNTKALELLDVSPELEVEGGNIYLDENGDLLGVFAEAAAHLAWSIIPKDTKEEIQEKFIRATNYALAHGLTSVNSCDVSMTNTYELMVESIYELYRDKLVPLRYFPQTNLTSMAVLEDFIKTWHTKEDIYDDVYRKGAIKLFKDGTLGARTALMNDPYADDPSTKGVDTLAEEDLNRAGELSAEYQMPIHVHTIGDQAIDVITDAFIKFSGQDNPLRHTLVHCQITTQDMLEKLADNDICIQFQPIFLEADMPVVANRVGNDKAMTSYAFNTMYNKLNGHAAFGTDAPVEDLDPFRNIQSAVTRKPLNEPDAEPLNENECVSVEDAIDLYTIESAYGTFMEDKIGRIKKGYYADFVVLDRDIFTIDPSEIKDITVDQTYINGQCVFEKIK